MTRANGGSRLRSEAPQPSEAIQPSNSLSDLKPINPDVFYVEAETAAFLRLKTPKTLTVWRARQEHPELVHIKKFGRVLYKGSAILAFLEGTAEAPTAKVSKPRRRKVKP